MGVKPETSFSNSIRKDLCKEVFLLYMALQSQRAVSDPGAYERAQYQRVLSSWRR